MSQFVDNHPLGREFPEFKDRIHSLKTGDAHFSRLFDEYEAVDRDIVRAEQGVEHRGDFDLEELKKKRLALKDQLYALLKTDAGA